PGHPLARHEAAQDLLYDLFEKSAAASACLSRLTQQRVRIQSPPNQHEACQGDARMESIKRFFGFADANTD
ncbi:hypothetical protein, partial [Escherichia coli]|uniref:hypothetical protein n=1 Tax=Escherichia coli TaxID=562 RepID=UPI00256F47F2